MAYRPPHKRNSAVSLTNHVEKSMDKPKDKVKDKLKDEFPALAPVPEPAPLPKMNFASLFKNVEKKKKKARKLKWGTVLLTKNGIVDSMTPEEREEEETWKSQQTQEERLWSMADRLVSTQNVRRIYDPLYESPDELTVSTSEEDPEEEEEEVLTDEYEEGEFEPEI
jgi:hypothetical protein